MSAAHYHHLLALDHHLLRAVHFLGTQLLGDTIILVAAATFFAALLMVAIGTKR